MTELLPRALPSDPSEVVTMEIVNRSYGNPVTAPSPDECMEFLKRVARLGFEGACSGSGRTRRSWRRLERIDPERFGRWLEEARDIHQVRKEIQVDEVVEGFATKEDANPSLVTLWAKRHHPGYRDRTQHEVTGEGGGPVRVEGVMAVAGLSDVFALARRLGVSGPAGLPAGDVAGALPGAQSVLPDPVVDVGPAGAPADEDGHP